MITSRHNPQVIELLKLGQRKYRHRLGLFLAEGLRLVEDGLVAGWTPVKLILSPPLLGKRAVETVEGWDYPRLELSPELMALAGDTETSQGVMAVFERPSADLDNFDGDLVLIMDGLRDPGNAGAIMRSCSAVGAHGVIALTGSVDLSSPKVVRASMGGVFRVPWVSDVDAQQVIQWADAAGFQLVRLEPRGGMPFHLYDYSKKLALVVGNEAEGIRPELFSACSGSLTIPMPGGQESLNAAMAATLVLYQALIYRGL